MGVLGRLRSLFARSPRKNTGAPHLQGRSVADYHRKAELKLRVGPHVKAGIKAWAKERGTTVSELTEIFYSGIMWGRQAKKLRKLLEELPRAK